MALKRPPLDQHAGLSYAQRLLYGIPPPPMTSAEALKIVLEAEARRKAESTRQKPNVRRRALAAKRRQDKQQEEAYAAETKRLAAQRAQQAERDAYNLKRAEEIRQRHAEEERIQTQQAFDQFADAKCCAGNAYSWGRHSAGCAQAHLLLQTQRS